MRAVANSKWLSVFVSWCFAGTVRKSITRAPAHTRWPQQQDVHYRWETHTFNITTSHMHGHSWVNVGQISSVISLLGWAAWDLNSTIEEEEFKAQVCLFCVWSLLYGLCVSGLCCRWRSGSSCPLGSGLTGHYSPNHSPLSQMPSSRGKERYGWDRLPFSSFSGAFQNTVLPYCSYYY